MKNHPELAGGETSYFSPTPSLCTLLILALCFLVASPSNAGLSFDFYAASCPTAEFMDKNTLRAAPAMDPTIPGKQLGAIWVLSAASIKYEGKTRNVLGYHTVEEEQISCA
ncbi:hypothetical protein SLEP1_g59532, partial [Rubroshorea leprosula]